MEIFCGKAHGWVISLQLLCHPGPFLEPHNQMWGTPEQNPKLWHQATTSSQICSPNPKQYARQEQERAAEGLEVHKVVHHVTS